MYLAIAPTTWPCLSMCRMHSPELEPYASFLTKTVEQDGIWYAMEKLGLLQE
jgi:hydroxymethylpyrimidine pyrophosphatase-like HAD family hydrolase